MMSCRRATPHVSFMVDMEGDVEFRLSQLEQKFEQIRELGNFPIDRVNLDRIRTFVKNHGTGWIALPTGYSKEEPDIGADFWFDHPRKGMHKAITATDPTHLYLAVKLDGRYSLVLHGSLCEIRDFLPELRDTYAEHFKS